MYLGKIEGGVVDTHTHTNMSSLENFEHSTAVFKGHLYLCNG